MNKDNSLSIFGQVIGLIGVIGGAMISQGNQSIGWLIMGLFGIIGIIGLLVFINKGSLFKEKSHIQLEEHELFLRIDSKKAWVKKKYFMPNKVKQEIFQDLLLNVLDIYKQTLTTLIEKYKKFPPKDTHKFITDIHYYINEIIAKITVYYQFNDRPYSKEDKEVLKIVIDKFLTWHGAHAYTLKNLVEKIVLDEKMYNGSLEEKFPYILSYFEHLIHWTLIDAKTVFARLNGEFRNKYFNGKLIGL